MKSYGIVIRILSDDLKGSRHQRFVIRTPSGKEILIIHNIDIASKITFLEKGDKVEFCGEYHWNNQGGMVHWTHADPHGVHPNGWIKHRDRLYQ